jgi:hypothetical protein
MKVAVLTEEEWLNLYDQPPHNSPTIQNQKEENLFQTEVRKLYHRLVESLSIFGEEGDYYGISDFAVQPDLADRPTVRMPPAAHVREFHITLITPEFYRSDYLSVLHSFLCFEAPAYRIIVAKDFDPTWVLRISLTVELAQIHCTNAKELSRLQDIFGGF